MARLRYPLPAWLPVGVTVADAAAMLPSLLQTKPSRAHALRLILARIADTAAGGVPDSAKWSDFAARNGATPLQDFGDAGQREPDPEPETPRAAPAPQPAAAPAPVDMATLRALVAAAVAEVVRPEPVTVTVVTPDAPPRAMGVQHKSFPHLLLMATARDPDGHRLNIWLPGPAGSGKTRGASEVAKALSLAFYFCGALDSPYALLGFTDAQGRTVRTGFREAYEHGGVFLLDEIDGSDPSVPLALNAALANGHCAFPDAVVARHPDCVIIAAANTWGHGGTFEYVGRMKQDAAFTSRFVVLPWEYDAALEAAIGGDADWTAHVQRVRRNAADHKVQVVISPRASINGAALLAAGLPRDVVEMATLRQGMDGATWARVAQ